MNQEHRDLLERNLVTLSSQIDLNKVSSLLLQKGIFNKDMMDDILAHSTDREKKEVLILELRTRGPKAFETFYDILVITENYEGAQILQPYIKSRRKGGSVAGNGEANQMRVKHATEIKEGPRIYRMRSRPRGYCLIINNVEFEPPYVYRKGSEYDADRLQLVFEELCYKVERKENLTAMDMIETLAQFSNKSEHADVDSCVVIIMTHGEKDALLGIDNQQVLVAEVIELFNNANCEHLKGKPKMFFVQACRGSNFDEGASGVEKTDSGPIISIPRYTRIPTYTDMLIAYSTIEGYVSMRNEVFGAWFCQILATVLMEESWCTNLTDMLKEVAARLKSLIARDGTKQAPQLDLRGWDKSLYFNPGL